VCVGRQRRGRCVVGCRRTFETLPMDSLPLSLVARTADAEEPQSTPAQGALESAGAGITGGTFVRSAFSYRRRLYGPWMTLTSR
jgi:hypothetical protein